MSNNRRKRGPPPVVTVLVVTFLLTLALFLVAWQTENVGEGIQTLRLFGDRSAGACLAFAAALQGTATMISLLLPLYFTVAGGALATVKRCVAIVMLVFTGLAISGFEFLHTVALQLLNSQGADMLNVEKKELARLHAQVTEVSDRLAHGYSAQVTALQNLARESEAGQDESGRKTCGPICTGYWRKEALLRQQYADLARAIRPPGEAADLRSMYIDAQARLELLQAQAARHGEMYQTVDEKPIPADVKKSIEDMVAKLGAKESEYEEMTEINPKALAVAAAVKLFRNALVLDFSGFTAAVFMPLAYSMAPMLSLIALSSMIWRMVEVGRPDPIEELAQEVESEQLSADQLEQLARARQRSFRASTSAELWRRGSHPGPHRRGRSDPLPLVDD